VLKNTDVPASSLLDRFKLSVVAVLVVCGVYGNSFFSGESVLYRALALCLLAVVAIAIGMTTHRGRVLWDLMRDARAEVRKVVWPTRQETVQTTVAVVLVVVLMSLVLWGLDSLLNWAVGSLVG